jgi:hypothetical protein
VKALTTCANSLAHQKARLCFNQRKGGTTWLELKGIGLPMELDLKTKSLQVHTPKEHALFEVPLNPQKKNVEGMP